MIWNDQTRNGITCGIDFNITCSVYIEIYQGSKIVNNKLKVPEWLGWVNKWLLFNAKWAIFPAISC